MALGARGGAVLKSVMGEALGLVGIGAAIGVVAALAFSKLLSNLLYGIAPSDQWSIAAAIFLMISVSTLAAYLPARRASRVDPSVALRYE
ncbi:MAG: hypothetical protein HY646_13850 [Acidobacteria bacterium]|nr:hypothetical protein [Acidobacteriota bacterium]